MSKVDYCVLYEYCLACDLCIKICPTGAINKFQSKYSINPVLCIRCDRCIQICPDNCIIKSIELFNPPKWELSLFLGNTTYPLSKIELLE